MSKQRGLKDHEIAILVNALNKELSEKFCYLNLPQAFRGVISCIVVRALTRMDRRIDGDKKPPKYPFVIEEYNED